MKIQFIMKNSKLNQDRNGIQSSKKIKEELVNEIENQISFLQGKCRPKKLERHLSSIINIENFVLAKKEISNEEFDFILNHLAIKVVAVLENAS